MDAIITRAADILLDMEAEMRRLGLWEVDAPSAQALASTMPFCHDTLELQQWLQWVFVPRVRDIIENELPLPAKSDIAPLAEYRFQEMERNTDKLINLIRDFDRLVSG
jgi:uncharacterized protein YqcC (DUF446 family)